MFRVVVRVLMDKRIRDEGKCRRTSPLKECSQGGGGESRPT